MENSNVKSNPIPPTVIFQGQLKVEVQERTSPRTGNVYEALILKHSARDIILSLDRTIINDVKVYLLTEDI